jgi:hypothetical protein
MAWQSETTQEKLARLRAALEQAQNDLIEAEAELADRAAEVYAFEAEFEAKVGRLVSQLEALEAEVRDYLDRIQQWRNQRVFGGDYRSVEEQYRRTWQVPPAAPKPPPQPPTPATEAQIKKLYRELARRFHPDLGRDDAERAYRTEKMRAVNDAYAARSMVELAALAQEAAYDRPDSVIRLDETEAEMIKALENEIARCRRRLREIDFEMRNLHNRPSVEISLEAKLARRQGRNLLAEMAADLERKIARKTAERDMMKAQFDSLDADARIH